MNLPKLNEAKAHGLLALHYVGLAVIAVAAAYGDAPDGTVAPETTTKPKKPKAAAPAETPAAPAEPAQPAELPFEELTAVAAKFAGEHGKAKALEIIAKFGAAKLSEIKPSDRAAAKKAFEDADL